MFCLFYRKLSIRKILMTIADDVKTVLSDNADTKATLKTIVDAIHEGFTAVSDQAGATADLTPVLDRLKSIQADLEPTPTGTDTSAPTETSAA